MVGTSVHEPTPGSGESLVQDSIELEIRGMKCDREMEVNTHIGLRYGQAKRIRVPDPFQMGRHDEPGGILLEGLGGGQARGGHTLKLDEAVKGQVVGKDV